MTEKEKHVWVNTGKTDELCVEMEISNAQKRWPNLFNLLEDMYYGNGMDDNPIGGSNFHNVSIFMHQSENMEALEALAKTLWERKEETVTDGYDTQNLWELFFVPLEHLQTDWLKENPQFQVLQDFLGWEFNWGFN